MSAAGILFVYVIWRIFTVASAQNDPIAVQLTVACAVTVLYIFLSFWLVEEKLIGDLRSLKPAFSWSEFAFRIVLLMALSLMPTFVEVWIPGITHSLAGGPTGVASFPFSPADPIVLFLAILYLMFLLWDGIVFFGAPAGGARRAEIQAISRTFVRTDLLGLIILAVVEASRFINPNAASILLVLFILFSAYQIYSVYVDPKYRIHTRLLHRGMLR